ncbi:MAG: ABC transporter ATP-binding protein/permease [Bacteroidia bacterium]|jgi:ABC-type multidrug transport system fused ATPase/permease subunit|nr:ABC transporter ATP-binding protein/permease [Bacteroidia bacterium]
MKPNRLFSDLTQYIKEYYQLLGVKFPVFIVSTFIPALLDSIGITMIVPLLNLVMANANQPTDNSNGQEFAYKILSFMNIPINLNNILLFISGLFLFKFLVTASNSIFRSYLFAQVLKKTRMKMYHQVMSMEYLKFQQSSTGAYSNLAGVQLNQYLVGFIYLSAFFTVLIAALSYLAFSFFVDFKFSAIAGGCGLLIAIMLRGLNKKVKQLSHKTTENETKTTSLFIEAIQAFKYLKSTGGFGVFMKKLDHEVEQVRHQTFLSETYRGTFLAGYEPITIILMCFFIFLQVAILGKALTGMLLSVYLFHRALANIMTTQKDWQYLLNVNGGFKAVSTHLKTSAYAVEKTGNINPGDTIAEITFSHVSFGYADQKAIDDFNLKITQNKTIAFVGQSGAGKTTLVDLITLMLKPQTGNIKINGIDANDVDLFAYRSKIGFVTQEVNLFDDTIANNISLWQQHSEADVKRAIKQAYAEDFIMQLPEQLNTPVGDRGIRLSGGQKQRLSLARELFKNPSLLILDEATSALDSESESFIKETLDSLKGKLTIIMIAHRLSTVREADLIVVMDNGKIQTMGDFETLAANDPYFKKIVELQKV